jgi:hypothetical protein
VLWVSTVNTCAILSTMLASADRDRRLWRVGLFALALFTLLRGVVWVVVNPPLNAGDEAGHLMYVMQVRNTGALPTFEFGPDCNPTTTSTPPDPATLQLVRDRGYAQVVSFTEMAYESFQSPLYYLICALFAIPLAPTDALGVLYTARLVSVVLTVATVVLSAYALRELTTKTWLALGGAAIIASIPSFGYLGSIVTNDNMLDVFAAAVAFVALRVMRRPSTTLVPGSLLLGALTGGAFLSKASGIGLAPVALLAIAFGLHASSTEGAWWPDATGWWDRFLGNLKNSVFWGRMAKLYAIFLVGLLAVAGWCMIRNQVEYHDILASTNHAKYIAICWGPTIMSGGLAQLPRYLLSLLLLTPFSYLATFGWGDESIGLTAYYAIILPFLLIDIYAATRWLKRHWQRISAFQQMGLLVLAFDVIIAVLIFLSINITTQYYPVGRFLYISALPLGGFLAMGLLMPSSNRNLKLVLLLAVLIALNALTIGGYMLAGTGWMATHTAQQAHSFVPFLLPALAVSS